VGYYCRIRGIPNIFASFDIPSVWDAGGGTVVLDGDTYTWSPTLITNQGGFGAVSQRTDPKAGIGRSGVTGLTFRLNGTQERTAGLWQGLIATSAFRTDQNQTVLQADLAVDTTSGPITVLDTTGFATAPRLYIGSETILVDATANTTTEFRNISKRGAFGSQALFHIGDMDNVIEFGASGPFVADYPLVWNGRVVDIWVATGRSVGGVFVPFGSTIDSTEDSQIPSGTISRYSLSSDMLTVEMEVSSLEALLEREVASRLPKAFAGLQGSGGIQVDGSNNHLVYLVRSQTASGALIIHKEKRFDIRLQRDDGGGGDEDVPDGLYPIHTIDDYITHTMFTTGDDTVTSAFTTFAATLVNEGGVSTNPYQMSFVSDPAPSLDEQEYTLICEPGSLWGELGFEGIVDMDLEVDVSTQTNLATSSRKPALFRWPVPVRDETRTERRLYFWDPIGESFDFTPGFDDDDGNAVGAYIKIGNHEVVRVISQTEHNTGSILFSGQFSFSVSERQTMGSFLEEEVYIEIDVEEQEYIDIVQGLAFPGVSAWRMALYLLLGGSGVTGTNHATYDQGWRDSGAHIQADLVDVDSFEDVHERQATAARDNWMISGPTKLREILEQEARLQQTIIAPTLSATGYQLRAIEIEPTLESLASIGETVDDTVLYTAASGGIVVDTSAHNIINQINWKTAYDNAKGAFRSTANRSLQTTSIGTYGKMEPLEIEVRGIAGEEQVTERIDDIGQRIFGLYATPYLIVEVSLANVRTWVWEISDIVQLTHDLIPAFKSLGRGVDVRMKIFAKEDFFRPTDTSSRITLVSRTFNGARFSELAPTLKLNTNLLGGTNWEVSDHKFTQSGYTDVLGRLFDVDFWAAGYPVRVFAPGNEAAAVTALVSSVTASTGSDDGQIILDTDVSGAGTVPLYLELGDYSVNDTEGAWRSLAFISDGDGKLDRATLDDAPFLYT